MALLKSQWAEKAPNQLVDRQIEEKRSFYRRKDVAGTYDSRRFGGASGLHVRAREVAIVLELLPAGGVVADVGCGTGRLSRALRGRGDTVIPCDTSHPMLKIAECNGTQASVQGDAFALPFSTGRYDAATAIRLLFHFADTAPLLRELRRVVRPGGTLVCDTYRWSPRAMISLGLERWGPPVYSVGVNAFRAAAHASGWEVQAERRCFLASPYIYRCMPLRAVHVLERLERRVPQALLCRAFWSLTAV